MLGLRLLKMRSIQALFLISILFQSWAVSADSTEPRTNFDRPRYYPGSFPAADIIENTESFLGVPYELGGESRSGVDCSGLVYCVFAEKNKNLPRNVAKLMKTVMPVGKYLRPGDLLFFDTVNSTISAKREASHVGIYVGRGEFIHSASAGKTTGVIRSSLAESYYRQRYLAAGRLLEWISPLLEIPLRSRSKMETIEDTLPAQVPIDIILINNIPKKVQNGEVDLVIEYLYEGSLYFLKRIGFPQEKKESMFNYAFREGKWELRLIIQDMDSYTITFQVNAGA